jgi:ABC-type nitrate/sulfonate/bicarbonate transport system permease component
MMYESITNAVNNVGKKQIEMANIFKVSKWEQFKNVYIPISTPYIFSSFVASFGLVFKIALASQMVQTWVTKQPDYPSVGMYIAWAIKNNQYDIVIAWGMIAIILSLIFELVIVKISRICIPSKFNDLKRIRIFFSRNKKV